tara:strand:+ start:2662 stop:3945 length:1284 start_codon:yes stop_codon:yes gene_type:complete
MILLYRVVTTLLYPLLILLIIFRKTLNKEDKIRFKEKLFKSNFNIQRKENIKLIWFHAASIGEMKSIFPIINELNKKNKNLGFLITTITLSSGILAYHELKKFKNVQHRYFPLDVDFLIKDFLLKWKPDAIFLVDSEIWPNLILNSKKLKIPIAIINGRITKRSFNRWIFFSSAAKKIFNIFNLCLSSSIQTKEYLEKLNAKNVIFAGNIKLINDSNLKEFKNINEKFLSRNKFWLAVSTHKNEELLCIKVHQKLKYKFLNLITIIAPRHIDRVNSIKKICDNHQLKSQILTGKEIINDKNEIIIINSFGGLNSFYKYAKSVFVGKSTERRLKYEGGQNPIEAAKYGCKVYHGPFVDNFKDIYSFLKSKSISQEFKNANQLANFLNYDLKKSTKDFTKNINSINEKSEKTLNDTMKNINKFLRNEIN